MEKVAKRVKQDADYIFHELTRSICPECKTVIDAQIIIRDNKVYMRKRCPTHGWFEGIISSDAEMYVNSIKFNKPGTIPLEFSTEVKDGCPLDCGLCPEHKQHMCLGLIEVNTACNLSCPVCFANAGIGYSLTLQQVEGMLDRFVEIEGDPEVIQFSGGEPTIHPQILDMIQAAKDRGIRQVMINTNGVRIARDDRFLEGLAKLNPVVYFQFDGLRSETYPTLRGEDLLDLKMRALDRLNDAGLNAVLVAAVERGVNEDEVGPIIEFGLKHPAVRGVVLQPVTHVGRHIEFDPMQRVTIPDVIHGIVDQTNGRFPVASPHAKSTPTFSSTATTLCPCHGCWTSTNIWTTSPTGPCPSHPTPPTCKRPWKGYGRPPPCLAPKKRPVISNVLVVPAWIWDTNSPI